MMNPVKIKELGLNKKQYINTGNEKLVEELWRLNESLMNEE